MNPDRFANIPTEVCWHSGQLVRSHEGQLIDHDCWRAQLHRIEMEYCSDGRLRIHKKGMKGNNPNPGELDAFLMLAFLELGKRKVKFHYEGGGRLGDDFWDDLEED